MNTRAIAALAVAVLLPAAAAAHSVSDEIGVGNSQSSPRNPRTGFIYDTISGVADVSEPVALRFSLTLTHDNATKPAQGAQFGDTGGNITAGAVGLDWYPSEHVPLAFEVDFSPRSTQGSDTSITFEESGSSVSADGLLRATSSSVGLILSAGYDTAGDSSFETATNGSFSATHLATTQQVAAFQGANGPVSAEAIRSYCARVPGAKGCRQLNALFRARATEINQFKVSALVAETFALDTDATLNGAYYFYDQDPTQVGYFNIAAFGRTGLGAGVPIAPLRFTFRPEVTHRFGAFSVSLSYQYLNYVPGDGYGNSLGLKLQYKFSKAFKAWISASGQSDVDDQGDSTKSSTLALGVRYSF